LNLPFNLDGVSMHANRDDGDFDGRRQTLAGELLPDALELNGNVFLLGSGQPGAKNVLVPRGQVIDLPIGIWNRLYVIASAVGGDAPATFTFSPSPGSGSSRTISVREWQGPIGQWDSRLKEPRLLREVFVPPMTRGRAWTADAIQNDLVVQFDPVTGAVTGMDQIRRGFVKRDEIAWVGSHRHSADGDQPYIASYLFVYPIDLPAGARAVALPHDNRLRILALTAVNEPARVTPASPLYTAELLQR
jgi:alpha-mannosidase